MPDTEGIIHRLDAKMCWAFLTRNTFGRLAVSADDDVDIFPVNYFADGETLLFRTAPGSKLRSLGINSRVAFEIDGYTGLDAWSIVVKGAAAELTTPEQLEQAAQAPLNPWIPTVKDHYIRITPATVSGRYFDRARDSEN